MSLLRDLGGTIKSQKKAFQHPKNFPFLFVIKAMPLLSLSGQLLKSFKMLSEGQQTSD